MLGSCSQVTDGRIFFLSPPALSARATRSLEVPHIEVASYTWGNLPFGCFSSGIRAPLWHCSVCSVFCQRLLRGGLVIKAEGRARVPPLPVFRAGGFVRVDQGGKLWSRNWPEWGKAIFTPSSDPLSCLFDPSMCLMLSCFQSKTFWQDNRNDTSVGSGL